MASVTTKISGTTVDSISMQYDAMGRPTHVVESPLSLGSKTTSYSAYDAAGDLTTLALPSDITLNAAYDMKARLVSLESGSSGSYFLDNRSFNPADQVTSESIGWDGAHHCRPN